MSPGSRPSHGTFPERFPATSRMPPRITSKTPNPSKIFPSSRMATQPADSERQLGLTAGGRRQRKIEMLVGRRGSPPSARRAHDEPDLQQEWLDDFGER